MQMVDRGSGKSRSRRQVGKYLKAMSSKGRLLVFLMRPLLVGMAM